jgi:uncharacterized circularly permuted ATP-grasp superfamily protein/uncharacterized alpha-E superfamily protein
MFRPDMSQIVASQRENYELLADYQTVNGAFDELFTSAGELRALYLPLIRELDRLGPAELKRRGENVRRLVHEHGITYNVHGDARGMERPWKIDPVPFVLAADEWMALEASLIQRATLINRVLADCYGAQELIGSGWLPPALVFAQPDFLRPCHGVRAPQDAFLHFYAADLLRTPDGRWCVSSDRTQIPTGAGYALANRLVTSRILPEPFREEKVQRLAGFFRELQTSLERLALRRTDNPRVVLLTPGPYNETYFEQAWLARYLGYMLVEGQDLTVRDDRVFLKTLSGLEPVDVILRRVDDDFCDPLELRNDSMLGVPGLLEALRAGNVAVANAPGSGLLQSPAFLAFLPGLCRRLLGEELKLPSLGTWWCGQEPAKVYVLEHLDELFVKPAFRSRVRGMEPGRELSSSERENLRRGIEFRPHLFVGQQPLELSRAPSWSEAGLKGQAVTLRAYLVATENGYKVMPGGLTRVASDSSGRSVSMQHGGASKDTWVLTNGPVEAITLLHPANQTIELRRVGNNLPSRMADNFFWLGRYAERADGTARMLRSALLRINPESPGSALPVLTPILAALEAQRQIASVKERPELRHNLEALEAELLAAIFDRSRAGSLCYLADQLQQLAMILRHRTSSDLWRTLSQLDDRLTRSASDAPLLAGDAVGTINQTLLGLAAFQGLARENMTRAQGWRFLDMGYRIERALYLSTFLDAALHSPEADNPSVLEAVLEVCDSTITYRSRYNLLPHIVAVYDLVLLDDTNPRSILFQLNQLVKHFDRLPRERESALPSPSERILLECLTRLRLTDPHTLASAETGWAAAETAKVVQFIARQLPRLSDAISVSYFAHSTISRTGRGGEK